MAIMHFDDNKMAFCINRRPRCQGIAIKLFHLGYLQGSSVCCFYGLISLLNYFAQYINMQSIHGGKAAETEMNKNGIFLNFNVETCQLFTAFTV